MRRPSRVTVGAALPAALAAVLALGSCRDAAEPFVPVDRSTPDDPTFVRLTFSPGDDRTPLWSPDGDSIYYTATSWDGNPVAAATLLAIPATGQHPARELLSGAHAGFNVRAWLGAAALAPNGVDVAFVRLRLLPDRPCVGQRVCPMMEDVAAVRLTVGELHVRAIDSRDPLEDDTWLPLAFAGHSTAVDPDAPGGMLTTSEYFPFQSAFEIEGRAIFRPSWKPDGSELVVSDGLRLLRWTPADGATVEIPGTADGVSPAWSPDGAWIAYTRHVRTGTQVFDCVYVHEGVDQCAERRIVHTTAEPLIVLVRPDGSEERVLGTGADPAWAPDGSGVYASTTVDFIRRIVRYPIDGGAAIVIERTEDGVEPAASPDGRRLAFSRRGPGAVAARDIWVVDLP